MNSLKESLNMFITLSHASEHITDVCDDVICLNGGTCMINNRKPFCKCADGYGGNMCEKREYNFEFLKF